MYNINIPPEALEAAADKIEGQCPCMSRDSAIETARAACLAMLKAWPGMQHMDWNSRVADFSSHIILPLPKENINAEG